MSSLLVEIMVLKSELEDQIKNQTAHIALDIEKIIGKGLVNFWCINSDLAQVENLNPGITFYLTMKSIK